MKLLTGTIKIAWTVLLSLLITIGGTVLLLLIAATPLGKIAKYDPYHEVERYVQLRKLRRWMRRR